VAELETNLSAREYAEWFEIWKWQPWEAIPEPPPEIKPLDPLAFAKSL
jgi:hypothetical protein